MLFSDAADLVIQGEGKFEELMVCSHEISASTAQLVAASRVSDYHNTDRSYIFNCNIPIIWRVMEQVLFVTEYRYL